MRAFLKNGRKVTSIVVSFLIFVMSFSLITSFEVSATSSINTYQTYSVYDGTTGEFVRQYTLDAVPYKDNSRVAVDDTSVELDYSKNGVVKLMKTIDYAGTGFVVDSHVIATAAHCIYNRTSKKAVVLDSIKLYGTDGNLKETVTPVEIHVPQNYMNVRGATNSYDYALITVEEDLSDYKCFNLGTMLDSFKESKNQVSVTGFPRDVDGVTVNHVNLDNMYTFTSSMLHEDEVIAMQEAAGNSTSSIDGIRKIYYSVDAGGGSSGGPVYLTTVMNGKKYYTVIGIHVSGSSMFHSAVRMTTDLLHFYKNNDNLSW